MLYPALLGRLYHYSAENFHILDNSQALQSEKKLDRENNSSYFRPKWHPLLHMHRVNRQKALHVGKVAGDAGESVGLGVPETDIR